MWNFIAAIVALCVITGSNKPGGLLPGMFLARASQCMHSIVYVWFSAAHPTHTVIYLLAGVPLTYLIWYKPLYRGAQNDKAFNFAWFFLASFALLVFTVWSAVGAWQQHALQQVVTVVRFCTQCRVHRPRHIGVAVFPRWCAVDHHML